MLRSPHKNGCSIYDCSIVREYNGIKIPKEAYGGQLPLDANPSFARPAVRVRTRALVPLLKLSGV